MKRGNLIVIEGIDGAGKTTQARLLLARLRREKIQARLIHFPQYQQNVFGRLIREFLDNKHGNSAALDPYLASVLYAADRFESKKKVTHWLRRGAVVICDRYVSSNQIHQGGKIKNSAKRRKFFAWLERIEYGVFGIPRPSATLYLSLRPAVAATLLKQKDGVERSRKYNKESYRAGEALATRGHFIRIRCEKNGTLRSRFDIHEQVYAAAKRHL